MTEKKISGIQNDEHTVRFNQHLFDQSTIKIYQEEIARLEQERDEIQERILTLADTYQETRNVCKRLEQENKKLKYLISEEQCFEEGYNKCTKAYYTDVNYRSALEEIKRMLTSPYPGQPRDVLNIINEVLQ